MDLEDSELRDVVEANSEETVFQEMLQLDVMGFDEEVNSGWKKIPNSNDRVILMGIS